MTNLVDLIRSDCSIALLDGRVLEPIDIENCKAYYKKEIFEKLHGDTVGKVALIWTNDLDVILPAVKAMWELGVAISVHDFNLNVVTHPMFKNFYNHIDFIIGSGLGADRVLQNIPHIEQIKNSKGYVFEEISMPEYPTRDQISEHAICCVTHTSGTTGEPKIVKISHRTAIDLVKENIRLFEFNEHDRVLHHKTLHHGSLFLNYAVPAFCITNQHVWASSDTVQNSHDQIMFLQKCALKCQNENITKWLIPYRLISNLANSTMEPCDLSKTSLITVVGPSSKEMQTIFDKHHPRAVFNNFGCTEMGTLVVSKTQQHNINQYAPNRFTEFNQLVDWEIHPTLFRCKFKAGSEWQSIGDIVSIDNSEFTWHGRNIEMVFNEKKLLLSDLQKWTSEYLKTTAFTLVADFDLNRLYLAIFDKYLNDVTIDSINRALQQSPGFEHCAFDKLQLIEFENVVMGMKPSQPVLLWYFRGLQV
jgi:hypothetical protein